MLQIYRDLYCKLSVPITDYNYAIYIDNFTKYYKFVMWGNTILGFKLWGNCYLSGEFKIYEFLHISQFLGAKINTILSS